MFLSVCTLNTTRGVLRYVAAVAEWRLGECPCVRKGALGVKETPDCNSAADVAANSSAPVVCMMCEWLQRLMPASSISV